MELSCRGVQGLFAVSLQAPPPQEPAAGEGGNTGWSCAIHNLKVKFDYQKMLECWGYDL